MQGADLYDAHAIRLYSYCWSLVGHDAAHALREAFAAAAKQGVTDPLRLYELARRSCVQRGALDPAVGPTPGDDPLLRAAARLRPDHREALALSVEFEPAEIGELLGLAPDTVEQMIATARARLERSVLDACWPGPVPARYEDVLAAFEQRQLVHLLSLRSGPPPQDLRRTAVSAWETEKLPHAMAEAQLVVLNAAGKPARKRGRRRAVQTLTTVVTVAAAVSGAVFFTGGSNGTPAGIFTSIIPSSWSSSTNSSSKPKKTTVYPAGTKLDPVTQKPVIGTLVPTTSATSVTPPVIPPVPSATPTKSAKPTKTPTKTPTPSTTPTAGPTGTPTVTPTGSPTGTPTDSPTADPTDTGRPQD